MYIAEYQIIMDGIVVYRDRSYVRTCAVYERKYKGTGADLIETVTYRAV